MKHARPTLGGHMLVISVADAFCMLAGIAARPARDSRPTKLPICVSEVGSCRHSMIRIQLVLSGNTNCWPAAATLRRRALGSSNVGKTPEVMAERVMKGQSRAKVNNRNYPHIELLELRDSIRSGPPRPAPLAGIDAFARLRRRQRHSGDPQPGLSVVGDLDHTTRARVTSTDTAATIVVDARGQYPAEMLLPTDRMDVDDIGGSRVVT